MLAERETPVKEAGRGDRQLLIEHPENSARNFSCRAMPRHISERSTSFSASKTLESPTHASYES